MPNRLQHESSPYLQQHAHNPVDWYPWGDEAFSRARAENKPLLVSIGYSTCHWCHVMERESFENAEVAAYMNAHFVNIKVDREERPDVDHIYMEACQAINGQGGWPLNCFVLPDGRPFFAGTYYPPQPAHNRPAWTQLLQHMHHVFHQQPDEVEDQASRLIDMIKRAEQTFVGANRLAPEAAGANPVVVQNAYYTLEKQFDQEFGGFGGAPKFPGTMSLQFLLDYHYYTGHAPALQHLHLSLEHMVRGGIYDQLGGGFARYSTDREWLAPHFEKMLYDNALLVGLLANTHRHSPQPLYQTAIAETLAFVDRELSCPEGGFYSALDADSEGIEGKYYVWDQEEIDTLLLDDAPVFNHHYGVKWDGNWEGVNILWQAHTLAETAARFGHSEDYISQVLQRGRATLLAQRHQRIRPGLDDKILVGWNALMVTAFAQAYQALGHPAYRDTVTRQLDFLLRTFRRPDGGLYHTFKGGEARYDAFLDDYAFLIEALLAGYKISFDPRYLDEATTLTTIVLQEFLDNADGLCYFTSSQQTDVPLRRKEFYDNATPSGNSTMVHNLQQLGMLLGNTTWQTLANRMLAALAEAVERYPSAFARWALALMYQAYPGHEVAVVGPTAASMALDLQRHYAPNLVLMAAADQNDRYPLLANRPATDQTLIYVCRQYACALPVTTIDQTLALLN